MKFSTKLYQLRKKKGLSQEELAQMLDVARQTISKWELGDTVPDMDKLVLLSSIFEVSLDELVGIQEEDNFIQRKKSKRWEYEYISQRKLFGIPLVHVHLGFGLCKSKGIISIGNIAYGIFSIGIVSLGIFSFGACAIGVCCLAAVGLGIISLGAIVLGLLAIGAIACGVFAIGGIAIGIYSIGGVAVAKDIAYGGVACGKIAIGDKAYGDFKFLLQDGKSLFEEKELRDQILLCFPKIWNIIIQIFCGLV